MKKDILIRGAKIITIDAAGHILNGDILVEKGVITAIASAIEAPPKTEIIDAEGLWATPGFVQVHTHLAQSLFRAFAEDLSLLDWLNKRIFPLEAAHTEETLYWSAMLGIQELFAGGTTTILDMGTVHHTDSLFRAAAETGIRAHIGKAMMDMNSPPGLLEDTEKSITDSIELLKRWDGYDNGRLRYAFAPRFALSSSSKLFKLVEVEASRHHTLIHTHSSENTNELKEVKMQTGLRNVEYYHELGLTGPNLVLAHCIWLSENEIEILKRTDTRIAHCPSANLKLGSGIALIPELMQQGIVIGLGADGIPCNNTLSAITEMRIAGLIQKPRLGPDTMRAETLFRMATIEGAKVIHRQNEIGSLEIGKQADIVLWDMNTPHTLAHNTTNPYARIIYSANNSNVIRTIIGGKTVYLNDNMPDFQWVEIRNKIQNAHKKLVERAKLQ